MKALLCVMLVMGLWPAPASAASNQRAAAGNEAYAREAYDEAVEEYRQGLIDQPDSLLLRFNLGTALYNLGKYDEAAAAFTAVAASGEEQWIARAAYNLGNTLYRIGEGNEADDPKTAADSYKQALLVYRRAMAADAQDSDAKYGHEFVARKLKELLERQAEQEQQEQQSDEQQQDAGGDEDQEPGQQQGQQQEAEQQPDQQQGQESQEEQADPSGEQAQTAESGRQDQQIPSEQEQQESLDHQAARAILDTAATEELGPEDISRARGTAAEGRPAKDW